MRIVSNKIACKPPKSTQNQVTVSKGFAKAKAKLELTCLEVVYDSDFGGKSLLSPGDFIYIKNDATLQDWARTIYSLPGEEDFVLVPGDLVVAINRETRLKKQREEWEASINETEVGRKAE